LQVQTEYASRPAPRITTTILDSGRVIHKIGNQLERPIESPVESCDKSTYDQLMTVPGVKQVFHLDNDGNFVGAKASAEFQQAFKDVFKNIRQIVDIFVRLPEPEMSRERGVYEINRDQLYLASDGDDCYFVVFGEKTLGLNCEQAIRAIIDSD